MMNLLGTYLTKLKALSQWEGERERDRKKKYGETTSALFTST